MSSGLAPTATHLPTHLELPSTDGLPADNSYQPAQWILLKDSVRPHLNQLHRDGEYLVAVDMGIYFKITKPPLRGCRCPDFFYVPDVPAILPDSPMRRSYVLWNEKVPPTLVIELVSDESRGTEHDTTPEEGKFWIYENAIKAAYYAIYDPDTARIELFHLKGKKYRKVRPDADGRFAIPEMKVKLGTHRETYESMTFAWLRFFDENGNMMPLQIDLANQRADSEKQGRLQAEERADSAEQRAKQEKQRAEQERQERLQAQQRAEQEKQRADSLAAKLRDLGVDPS